MTEPGALPEPGVMRGESIDPYATDVYTESTPTDDWRTYKPTDWFTRAQVEQVRDEAYAAAERDVVAYIESAAAICRSAPGNKVRRDLARQIKAGEHR